MAHNKITFTRKLPGCTHRKISLSNKTQQNSRTYVSKTLTFNQKTWNIESNFQKLECTSTHQRLLEIRQTNDRQTWCVNLGREKNGQYVYVHLPNFEGHVASVPSSPRHPQVLLTSWYTEMDWSDLVGNSHWTSENGYRNQANTIVTIHCFSRKLFFYLCGGCYGSFSTTRGFRHRSSACKYFWEVP